VQLVNDGATVGIAAEKDQNVAFLQLSHDGDGGRVGAGRADDGGKSRHAAIHQLDAPRTQLDIVNGAVQVTAVLELCVTGVAEQLETGVGLRLRPIHKADALNGLRRQEGRLSAVERFPQVGNPQVLVRHRMQELFGVRQRKL